MKKVATFMMTLALCASYLTANSSNARTVRVYVTVDTSVATPGPIGIELNNGPLYNVVETSGPGQYTATFEATQVAGSPPEELLVHAVQMDPKSGQSYFASAPGRFPSWSSGESELHVHLEMRADLQ